MIKKRFLCSSLAVFSAFLLGSTAFAQATQAPSGTEAEGVLEEVIVTGVRFSMTEAVEIKRDSVEIVDSIVSEDIGKFPDNNIVEAMQRIAGVQVTNRGAGEVATVSIRGLSDVTTTINGRNIFTSSGRQVALADIPATLVNRVDVYKTRSPEQISRGLAGQIDIHTNRPFDFDEFRLLAQGRAIYQEQADEIDPNLSFLISNRWDTGAGEFGALFNASYVKTTWLNQGVHAGASVPFRTLDDPAGSLVRLFPNDPGTRWTPGLDAGLPTAPGSTLDIDPVEFLHARDAMFQPHVSGERERPAWNLSFQWAPNETSEYLFEVFYNGYENTQHNSLFFTFVDWWGAVDPADPVEIYPDTNVIKSRYVNFPYEFISGDMLDQNTDSYLYALGGEWDLTDTFVLKSELVYQDSEFEDQFFALRMDKVSPRLFVDFNTGGGVPYVEFFDNPDTPQDESDLTDPAQWNLAQLYDNGQSDAGDAFSWTADGDLGVEWGWIDTLGFGLRYDDRTAEENGYVSGDRHCNAAPGCAGSTYADFPGLMGVTTDHFDGQARVLTSWAIPTLGGLQANMEALRAAYGYLPGSQKTFNNEFNIDETQTELYAQADFYTDLGAGMLDGRFGFRWLDQETDMAFPDPTGATATATNSNDTILPSIMVRWGITEDLMARVSYTEVFELPTFAQLSPYVNYVGDVTNIGYGTATGGNPDLEPIESENYDISLEWYFSEGSVLYGTWFQRDITNNIVPFRNVVLYNDPNDNPDRGLYPYVLSQPDNAGEAQLDGWEFGLTWFPVLEGWWDGIGFQGSYTILDSEQEIPVTDVAGNVVGYDILPIFGVSDSSYSAILAYDRETFSTRLSYFWREEFQDRNEAALFANPLAIWKSPEKSLDFQFTWMMTERWTLTFDATNLTEEVFNENYGNQPQIFNHTNWFYSRTFALGVRFQM
jgi:iron complex outermembrane recepter protein